MRTLSFNRDWAVGDAGTMFSSLFGDGPAREAVTLPHDAIRDRGRSADSDEGSHTGYFQGGTFEHEKTFEVPAEWADASVILELKGAYRDAVVRINGEFAAHRASGYAGILVDLNPYLVYGGTNTVNVVTRAHQDSRWYTGSGIYRDTWLHVGGEIHLRPEAIAITTPEVDTDLAVVEAAVTVSSIARTTSTVQVVTRVVAADGAVVASATAPVTIKAGGSETARLRHYLPSPELWGPASPHLYTLETSLEQDVEPVDVVTTTFGIRRLQLDTHHGLRINGETVKLRGACIHHDNGPLGGVAISRAEFRRIERLKAAGFNAIRSSHNPTSRALLDACDRLGMIVVDELSDVWTTGKTLSDHSIAFTSTWEKDIESMVAKDFNHPSVVFYSIGNEIQELGRPLGARWGRHIAEKFRELDSSRYITNGVNCMFAVPDAFGADIGDADLNTVMNQFGDEMLRVSASELVSERTEESFSVLDVSGINYGESRYELDRELFPNRIIMGSETFAGNLDVLWPLVMDNPHVIGDFTWTGWDYLGEAGIGRQHYTDDDNKPAGLASPYRWLAAHCGTIDLIGNRRPISYWREIVWGLRSTPYITVMRPEDYGREPVVGPWSWRDSVSSWSWSADPGSPIELEVYSDADEVELLIDGASVARSAVGGEKAYIARFTTEYRQGELVAVAYRDGVETGRTALQTASEDVTATLHTERTTITANTHDLAYIDIVLQDADGNLANHLDAPITVSIDGPATLAALGTGRPDTTEPFGSHSCTTYDGRALAILRPTGTGSITVTVDAGAIGSKSTTISAVGAIE